jgi:hypothetical protein
MSKVVIDLSMSFDGFIAGPGDSADHPLGLKEWTAEPVAARTDLRRRA